MTEFDNEMMAALEKDGQMLEQLTGEKHGPFCTLCLGVGGVFEDEDTGYIQCPVCKGSGLYTKTEN